MKLRNYQEDVVLKLIEIAAEDRSDIELTEHVMHDIAAYTLNRILPRYIMSERGFTRLASELLIDNSDEAEGTTGFANLVELMFLINKAMDVVTARRPAGTSLNGANGSGEELSFGTDEVQVWYNFPQMIGRVVDHDTGAPVFDARVSLLLDDQPAKPAESGWSNPYVTNTATKGYFSFWPRSERGTEETKGYQIRVQVDHPDYESAEHVHALQADGELRTYDDIYGDSVLSVDSLELTHR